MLIVAGVTRPVTISLNPGAAVGRSRILPPISNPDRPRQCFAGRLSAGTGLQFDGLRHRP